MPDAATLTVFLPAMLAITLAPGADTLFVVGSALRAGRRGGILATLGIISGGVVHIGFATIGLSSLLMHSALAFSAIKYAGAAYLVYLGVRALLARERATVSDDPAALPVARLSSRTLFAQGFLTNVLNPKVALFVLAFLPQFVSPARGAVWSQFLVLGGLWYLAGLLWLGGIGVAVGNVRRAGGASKRLRAAFRYLTATIFIGLGIRIALPDATR
jgi:threonine/homoserine/homoserine lactone efflux protein